MWRPAASMASRWPVGIALRAAHTARMPAASARWSQLAAPGPSQLQAPWQAHRGFYHSSKQARMRRLQQQKAGRADDEAAAAPQASAAAQPEVYSDAQRALLFSDSQHEAIARAKLVETLQAHSKADRDWLETSSSSEDSSELETETDADNSELETESGTGADAEASGTDADIYDVDSDMAEDELDDSPLTDATRKLQELLSRSMYERSQIIMDDPSTPSEQELEASNWRPSYEIPTYLHLRVDFPEEADAVLKQLEEEAALVDPEGVARAKAASDWVSQELQRLAGSSDGITESDLVDLERKQMEFGVSPEEVDAVREEFKSADYKEFMNRTSLEMAGFDDLDDVDKFEMEYAPEDWTPEQDKEATEFVAENFGKRQRVRLAVGLQMLQAAAQAGHVEACYKVAQMVFEEDLPASLGLLEYCVGEGHLNAIAKLAEIYYFGKGSKPNKNRAINLFRQAADRGHVTSMFNLGQYYSELFQSTKTKKFSEEASFWFTKAADLGDRLAMFNLAVCYREGFGVERSMHLFEQWMREAADSGSVAAQITLAKHFEAPGAAASHHQKMEAARYWEMASRADEDDLRDQFPGWDPSDLDRHAERSRQSAVDQMSDAQFAEMAEQAGVQQDGTFRVNAGQLRERGPGLSMDDLSPEERQMLLEEAEAQGVDLARLEEVLAQMNPETLEAAGRLTEEDWQGGRQNSIPNYHSFQRAKAAGVNQRSTGDQMLHAAKKNPQGKAGKKAGKSSKRK